MENLIYSPMQIRQAENWNFTTTIISPSLPCQISIIAEKQFIRYVKMSNYGLM
jgi:hypothetical protein